MKLLDYKEVAAKLGIHPINVWKIAKDPTFPKRTNILGPRTTRWVEEEIDEWIVVTRRNENEHCSSGEAVNQ